MKRTFDPRVHFEMTRKSVDYSLLGSTPDAKYQEMGFMCGLEVHQQLDTREKLFCHCPAGIFHDFNDYDAEIIRHMRPTLSELGEYDGTALMEFRTRKQIIYRIKNETACTYEIDDTPPFLLNREALQYAMEVALMTQMSIVGELHITRKQYLDGSIPTGFQRTGIIGVEGSFPISGKTIRVIQLSLEEDSCREVSDIRHTRVYSTDRLGMPLIETVTYPDMKTPWEAREAAQTIRYLARSSGRVRTGIGAAREDVNVSISGGTRVEIKGVSHILWIPRLTHNEAFRQKSLLTIQHQLIDRGLDPSSWKPAWQIMTPDEDFTALAPLREKLEEGYHLVVMALPGFRGVLSHFTQPDKPFISELSGRLKVIPCLEHPNLYSDEDLHPLLEDHHWLRIRKILGAGPNDALLLIPAPDEDIATAVETIDERCKLAFSGVPNETRKSLPDGTTVFERVLPGPDRMYPDTDSAPIPIPEDFIEEARRNLPVPLETRLDQLRKWKIPQDAWGYLLRNDLLPLLEDMTGSLPYTPRMLGTLFAHRLRHLEPNAHPDFTPEKLYDLLRFIHKKGLHPDITVRMLKVLCQHPNMELESVLSVIHWEPADLERITSLIPALRAIFRDVCKTKRLDGESRWIMGNLRKIALGNIPLSELRRIVDGFEEGGDE